MINISYDDDKNARNFCERELCFDRAKEVDFASALIAIDDRRPYGEVRYVALGYLDKRLHVTCFTETQIGIRVISFRKANEREAKRYGKTLTID